MLRWLREHGHAMLQTSQAYWHPCRYSDKNRANHGSPQSGDNTQPPFCSTLYISSAKDDAALESRQKKRKQARISKWIFKSADVVRGVRFVHGQKSGQDRPEIWMYVPFVYNNPSKNKNQSNQKRKGY